MDTIIIKSSKKVVSDLFLELAKQIKAKAKVLTEDEIEDLRLNKMLLNDEENLEEVPEKVVLQTLRRHGAKL